MTAGPYEILGEACRRMAVSEYLAADRELGLARILVRDDSAPEAIELAEARAAEREQVADVFAWYATQALWGTACICRAPRPCPHIQGRDLLKLPRVTYLTTEPAGWSAELDPPPGWEWPELDTIDLITAYVQPLGSTRHAD